MAFTDEQQRALKQPMPREHVATREGGGGKALSYIEGHLVIRQMNAIFGHGGWSYDCTPTLACEYEAEAKNGGKQWRCTFTSRCILKVGDCTIVDVGAGHGIDRDRGAAIESAIKEAATDSLKRCCKSLGDPLGLALYDKQQTNVGEVEPAREPLSAAELETVVGLFGAVKTKGDWERALAARSDAWARASREQQSAIDAAAATTRDRITKGAKAA